MRRWGWDLRFAARLLRRDPGFALAAILTLALCIGANTALFSVVDAVLLRQPPYPHADRLAMVVSHFRVHGEQEDQYREDGATWQLLHDRAADLDVAVYAPGVTGINFATGGHAQFVRDQRVSAGFFSVLGVSPMLGREFTPAEDRPGGPPVAILSYGFWRSAVAGNPSIIGGQITLRGVPYTVVGVTPEGFRSTAPVDVWTPLQPSTSGEGGGTNYSIMSRLRPGVGWPQANAEVSALGAAIFAQEHLPAYASARLELLPLARGLAGDARQPLLILWGAVGLLLLIGCANVSSLLLARASARAREIATRLALGARRVDVVRQLMAESLLLAVIGGLVGLGLAWAGTNALMAAMRTTFGFALQPQLIGRAEVAAIAAAVVLSLFAVFAFGLWPAWQTSRVDLRLALTETGLAVAGPRHRWPRRVLVVVEVALGVVLLIGAGLLLRTFAALNGLAPGFDARHVVAVQVSLADARYAVGASASQFLDRTLARIRATPGVEAAGVGLTLPYEQALNDGVRILDGPRAGPESYISDFDFVTPGFFPSLRIPVLRGRDLAASDGPNAPPVALVNQAFARRFYRGADPIGMHLGRGQAREIIGVVGNVEDEPGWGNFGPVAAIPTVYIPWAQIGNAVPLTMLFNWFTPSWVVRSSLPPTSVEAAMNRIVNGIDPMLPIAGFSNMSQVEASALATQRGEMILLALMAGLALVLAAIGIYGIIAKSVGERTRELGIRMALGASGRQAVATLALPGVALAGAGVVIGCLVAWPATHLVQALIWGVNPVDPATFAVVAGGFLLIAAIASLVPAWRITRLSPAAALHIE